MIENSFRMLSVMSEKRVLGTISQLLTARSNDKSDAGFKDWRFMTVHFWGENPTGDWKLHIIDRVSLSQQHSEYLSKCHRT